MICPWLKETRKYANIYDNEITEESFAECKMEECPFYVGTIDIGGVTIDEHCRRAMSYDRE